MRLLRTAFSNSCSEVDDASKVYSCRLAVPELRHPTLCPSRCRQWPWRAGWPRLWLPAQVQTAEGPGTGQILKLLKLRDDLCARVQASLHVRACVPVCMWVSCSTHTHTLTHYKHVGTHDLYIYIYTYIYMYIYIYIYLFIYLVIYLSIHEFMSLSICGFVYLFINLYLYTYVYMCMYSLLCFLFIRLVILISICLFVCLSIYIMYVLAHTYEHMYMLYISSSSYTSI